MFFKSRRFRRFQKSEDGAVMVIAAFGLVAFLSIVSLVTDMGLKYHQKSKLQSAMDAAALAAVRYMPDEAKARETALEYVEKNGFSTESVVVEFPTNEIVRVSDSREGKTIFASLFNVDFVQINAKAAAKYVNKNMAVDFDYLMFHGNNSSFTVNGHYNIGGSVFGNGNVYADGGSGSQITGAVVSAQSAGYNQHSITVNRTQSNAASQKMPDFDETIMSIAPTADEDMFKKSYNHIGKNGLYINRYSSDTTLNSVISINGGTYCAGNLSTGWGAELLTIYGDLYVEGDFTPQCPVYVTGNVYCGGNLTSGWDKNLRIGKNLYVEGDTSFQGNTSIYGDYFYTGGSLIRGSSYSLQCDCETYVGKDISLSGPSSFNGAVYCNGNFRKEGNTSLNVNGNVYAYGTLNLQSGGTVINGDIFVWGKSAVLTEPVTDIFGPLTLNGNVYNNKGELRLSGQGAYQIKGVLYSGGSIFANQGPQGITLDGCLIAEDDIYIGGSTHTYNETGGTLSIYSRKGDITLYSQQGGFEVWGMIYAPEGDVELASGDFNIHGSIIGDTITCNPGGLNMSYNDRALPYSKAVKTAVLVE